MVTRLRQIMTPPKFEDQQQRRAAAVVYGTLLLIAIIAVPVWAALLVAFGPSDTWDIISWIVILALPPGLALTAGAMWMVRRGQVKLAGLGLCLGLWIGTTAFMWLHDGLLNLAITGYLVEVILAALVLGTRASALFAIGSGLSAAGLLYAELAGLRFGTTAGAEVMDWVMVVLDLGLTTALIGLSLRSETQANERSRLNELALNESNRTLREAQGNLQQQMDSLEKRSRLLQAAEEVSRATTSILSADELMAQAVELIAGQFGLYHAGLLLLESEEEGGDRPEWAVLRAGSGQAGQAMVARGHRVHVGDAPLTTAGRAIVQSLACVATDDGAGGASLATPDLPNTRSEAALPLSSRGRVLGALALHSEQPGEFDEATMQVLQLVADQLAAALENARLYAASRQALDVERQAYGQASRDAWRAMRRARRKLGFRRDAGRVAPAGEVWRPEMGAAVQAGAVVAGGQDDTVRRAAAPVKVRGETIAVIGAQKPEQAGEWTREELATLETLADQLGVALESARLFQDARRHAAHEQAVRHITEQMRRGLEVESILQATVAELGQALGVPRAYVRLGTGTQFSRRSGEGDERDGQAS